MGQQFPTGWQVEWLVVDDGSSDGTAQWLAQQAAQHPRLTVLQHEKTAPGKKGALAAGIRNARFDRLVLTDADCLPEPHWAHHMACALGSLAAEGGDGLDVVLGTCLPQDGPRILQFDALRVALQYAGEAAAGQAYMGVGRSLAYRGSLWEKLGGFAGHTALAGGDDDLFVQCATTEGYRVGLCPPRRKGAGTVALPAAHWREGWQRKRRHLSTAPRYRRRDQLKLGVDAALDPLIVLTALAGALGLLHSGGWIPLSALVLAMAVRSFTLSSFSREWGRRSFPIGDGLFLGPIRWILLASATLRNAFTSSPTWTQRAPTSRS